MGKRHETFRMSRVNGDAREWACARLKNDAKHRLLAPVLEGVVMLELSEVRCDELRQGRAARDSVQIALFSVSEKWVMTALLPSAVSLLMSDDRAIV